MVPNQVFGRSFADPYSLVFGPVTESDAFAGCGYGVQPWGESASDQFNNFGNNDKALPRGCQTNRIGSRICKSSNSVCHCFCLEENEPDEAHDEGQRNEHGENPEGMRRRACE